MAMGLGLSLDKVLAFEWGRVLGRQFSFQELAQRWEEKWAQGLGLKLGRGSGVEKASV
jgi:hypothetical protein